MMAANDEDGIDNDDGVDQCIVWWCPELRGHKWGKVKGWMTLVRAFHCRAHHGFAHVKEENDGN